jgi:hypothetical protein
MCKEVQCNSCNIKQKLQPQTFMIWKMIANIGRRV